MLDELAQAIKSNDFDLDDIEYLVVVKESSWSGGGKWQTKETIVRYKGQLFCLRDSRTGSYYSDYEYGDTVILPVEEHTEVVTKITYVPSGTCIAVSKE